MRQRQGRRGRRRQRRQRRQLRRRQRRGRQRQSRRGRRRQRRQRRQLRPRQRRVRQRQVGEGVGVNVGSGVSFGPGSGVCGSVSVGGASASMSAAAVRPRQRRVRQRQGRRGVGVSRRFLSMIGGARVGGGTGTCAGMQVGPPWRDGMKPGGQGVGPTGGRNTPQIGLPLIHCGVWPGGHDGGGGGRHDHWPLRQFGWPSGHGAGGGGLPPQT